MHHLSQHLDSLTEKSTFAYSEIMTRILDEATRQGATDAAVSLHQDTGFSADIRMQSVDTLAFHDASSVGVTVYLGQREGHASGNDMREEAIRAMVKAALDIARVSAEDPCVGLPDQNLIQSAYADLDLYHPWSITPSEAIAQALACERLSFEYDARLKNSDGVSIQTYETISGYAHTRGFSGLVQGTRHSMSASLIVHDADGRMQRDDAYTVARSSKDLMSIEALSRRVAERTLSRLGARPIPTQNCPVLFSSRVSSGLFSAFIQAISGSNLYKKNTFLLEALETLIFPTWMRIYDQPHLKGALGSAPFDGEGVITRPNVWVESGYLKQYVLGSYAARKLGLQSTANQGGVFNLTVEPSISSSVDLFKMMDRGLWVTDLMGQGINWVTGDYSRGASGFWIEHGEIQFPVEEITIAGSLPTMFREIIAVGTDRDPNYATRCGSVLLADMKIAGLS